MKKPFVFIPLMLALVVLLLSGCAPSANDTQNTATAVPEVTSTPADTSAADAELVLTLDELALYDGQDGNPAYIAVDGVIYDVTDVAQWNGGEHNGFTAGQDLTDAIKNVSPHGVSKLKLLDAVGKLAD